MTATKNKIKLEVDKNVISVNTWLKCCWEIMPNEYQIVNLNGSIFILPKDRRVDASNTSLLKKYSIAYYIKDSSKNVKIKFNI